MEEGASRSFSFIEPMQALSVEKLPEGDWLYEVKLDGYRALAFKDGNDVRLISRNNKPLNYPQVLDSLKLLAVWYVVLDGEIVALDEKGRSSFQLLQDYAAVNRRRKYIRSELWWKMYSEFLNYPQWRATRRMILLENPRCAYCGAIATQVHHTR